MPTQTGSRGRLRLRCAKSRSPAMLMLRAEVFGGERLRHDALVGEPKELIAAVDAGGDLESADPGRAEAAEDLDRRAGRHGQAVGGLDVDVTPSWWLDGGSDGGSGLGPIATTGRDGRVATRADREVPGTPSRSAPAGDGPAVRSRARDLARRSDKSGFRSRRALPCGLLLERPFLRARARRTRIPRRGETHLAEANRWAKSHRRGLRVSDRPPRTVHLIAFQRRPAAVRRTARPRPPGGWVGSRRVGCRSAWPRAPRTPRPRPTAPRRHRAGVRRRRHRAGGARPGPPAGPR